MITLNWKRATGCFFIAYIIVTFLATAISISYEIVFQPPKLEPGKSILEAPTFVATVPYHVLIMFPVWTFFAFIYFKNPRQSASDVRKETFHLSVLWLFLAIVTDFVCFVLIKHPYSLTPYEFYVVYQPWISLIYGAIFLSPFLQLVVLRTRW